MDPAARVRIRGNSTDIPASAPFSASATRKPSESSDFFSSVVHKNFSPDLVAAIFFVVASDIYNYNGKLAR